jgi:hypothetical protein
MFDLEKAITDWRQQMLTAGIKTPVPLEELKSHLRDEIELQMKSGLDEKRAFETAVQQIGQAVALKREFKKAHSTLLGDNTRHANMKTLRLALIIGITHNTLLWATYAVDWWTTGTTSTARTGAYYLGQILTYPPYILLHFYRPVFSEVAQLPFFLYELLDSCIWAFCLTALIYGFRRIHHARAA